MLEARTDVVGSLLRPPHLLAARERLARGELTPADFKQVEDKAVDEALALQETAGLAVVTDGEMRRLSFQSELTAIQRSRSASTSAAATRLAAGLSRVDTTGSQSGFFHALRSLCSGS